jgi:hypothetical protein
MPVFAKITNQIKRSVELWRKFLIQMSVIDFTKRKCSVRSSKGKLGLLHEISLSPIIYKRAWMPSVLLPTHHLISPAINVNMSRAQLLETTSRMIAWINNKHVNPANLATIVDQNVVVPIPYPGSTPDYAGLVAVTEKIHGASPDFNMAIRDSIVDETDHKVVLKINTTGTQTGYFS